MKKKKPIKHIVEEGSRCHVVHWVGERDWGGKTKGRAVCSEPDCEINHRDN